MHKFVFKISKAVLTLTAALAMTHGAVAQTTGRPFFNSQLFSYQTLRAFNHIPAGGADTGEMLHAIASIKNNDVESWYVGWRDLADKTSLKATTTADDRSKGLAYLRAHNYYRTAEFLLRKGDSRHVDTARQATRHFYMGLDSLGVSYQRMTVPYEGKARLNAVYFPADPSSRKPLILMVGGFDSTMEELYFFAAQEARLRGYPVLIYEGPGQGNVLREQGLTFIPEWERPTKAVLDNFLATHSRPTSIVMLGVSMGGYLASRAAAFDSRIAGLASFGVFYDGKEVAAKGWPTAVVQLLDSGHYDALLDSAAEFAASLDPALRWKLDNGEWTMGVQTSTQLFREFAKYSLAPVAGQIKQDVLLMQGTKDHLIPATQLGAFQAALTGARSVTTRVYDETFGAQEHCQLGASTTWQADFFDWLAQRFPVY